MLAQHGIAHHDRDDVAGIVETAAAETQQGADLHHEAPTLGEDAIPHYEPNEDRREGFDREKV